MASLTIVDHPLVVHRLSQMRERTTPTPLFRRFLYEIGALLAYEAARDLPMVTRRIETPITGMDARFLDEEAACLVSILRAGNGLLEGFLDAMPWVRVGHVGLYRDHDTHLPVQYYCKLPEHMERRRVFLLDPMLATGHSASAAIARIKEAGSTDIRFVCLVAAPEGVAVLRAEHPDVPVYTASLDERLNENAYIVPGLGDAGDRLNGTK
ncbi:MAG TPA: uracil phosphoribosyltransferase [Myxococcota bacterium]|nr:uracil phosphoribosyltransferase [Myxococcota bacterium]